MRTKVSTFCDRVIEAGWLLALLVVPLFFNVYSNRVFEPDKLGILRSIATIMAVAWLIRLSEEGLGKSGQSGKSNQAGRRIGFLRLPFVVPTMLLAAVYLLATAASVVPRISLWGSYQRLQGTYTTCSYMVVFALMLQNLRRREQLGRLLTTIILTSLPIALYGLMQHYRLDPLPWGGDVTARVASNMGNAIFVAAYMIMVVPITLVRIIQLQGAAQGEVSARSKAGFGVFFWVLVAAQMAVWSKAGFAGGVAASLVFIVLLTLSAGHFGRPMARFVLMGCYGSILSVQLVSIFFTMSRGPWLGLLAGLLSFGLLYLLSQRRRRPAIAMICASAGLLLFLVLINLPTTPFPGFRRLPHLGRLGQVFDIENGTGKVRVLIWEGVDHMLRADPLRTLIGYGPESMWVAYNRFYPPDLAHHESRNASPDRSHNETFDAVVITGLLGLAAYIFLWARILYYGLDRLGLVPTRARRRLLVGASAAGSILGVLLPLLLDRSLRFVGVSLPLGFLLGLATYMAACAFEGGVRVARQRAPVIGSPDPALGNPGVGAGRLEEQDTLLLVALIAAMVAHFVEIQFGIAIAATRTYFWVYVALIALLGESLVSTRRPAADQVAISLRNGAPKERELARRGGRRKRKARRRLPRERASTKRVVRTQVEPMTTQLLAIATVVGLMLATLAWDYTTNARGQRSPVAVIWSSLTSLAATGHAGQTSLGMTWLVTAICVVSLLAAVCELVEDEPQERDVRWWGASFGTFALVAGGIGGVFALVHAAHLGPSSDLAGLPYEYCAATGCVWLALATILYFGLSRPSAIARGAVALGYLLLLLISIWFIQSRNISIIKADILYKHGLRFDGAGQWDQAIHFYQRAVDVAPTEDYYCLFRGRALMERARLEQDPQLRDAYFQRALESLEDARRLNPLNTDNTWNLGRLYRTWGEMHPDAASRQEKLSLSREYYTRASQLSPHNAQIYNEWGDVCRLSGDADQALVRYEQSLALDQQFAQTYFLMGDLHLSYQRWGEAARAYESALALDPSMVRGWGLSAFCYSQLGKWDQAVEANLKALELDPKDYVTFRNLASCYVQLGEWDEAIEANLNALQLKADDYGTLKNLSLLYSQLHRPENALPYAQKALGVAPEQEKEALNAFLLQLRSQVGKD